MSVEYSTSDKFSQRYMAVNVINGFWYIGHSSRVIFLDVGILLSQEK